MRRTSLLLASLTLVAANAGAQQVNTGASASSNYIWSFGPPNTATYGQTFTAPVGYSSLDQFTFQLREHAGQPITAFTFEGYIAAWNGSGATGPMLYASGSQASPGVTDWTTYTFNTGGVAVTAGQTYVAFINTSAFIAANPGAYDVTDMRYGVNDGSDSYAGGGFVYMNNGSNFSALTTNAWDSFGGADAAFTASFSNVTATPEPASLALLGSGLLAIGGVAARRKRRAR